jgi:predicted glycoside hydrolase/deacetylase ChbG (UPF0249 family)/ketosteroid isomerase-like protein
MLEPLSTRVHFGELSNDGGTMVVIRNSPSAAHMAAILIALVILSTTSVADARAELLQVNAAFHDALREANVSALALVLDDRFTWTKADGVVEKRADLLEHIRLRELRYTELRTDQETVNDYGKAAVVTGRSSLRYTAEAKPLELRYTLTLIKAVRRWKVAAYHTTIMVPGAGQALQVRLGYPADAKLLILNADDLGASHSEDVASLSALDQKLISSATAMVPCPWFTEVAAYAKAHPEADLGLHLTLTAEWQTFRWGPVAPRALVPSLTGADGYFYADSGEVAKHAKLDEVEIEIRAQIERAKAMGLTPSHLDAHMHVLYATPELFGVFLKVAREYKLPIRMARNEPLFQSKLAMMAPGDPITDAIFSPGAEIPASGWQDYYVNLIKNLKPGVTEVFVHLARDDDETEAVMVNHADWGAAWRQRDLEAVSSPEFRKAREDNHVILIGWREIKKLL